MSRRASSVPGRWIRRSLLLGVLVYASLFAWTGHRVGRAQAAFWEGKLDEAHALLSRASSWPVRSGRVRDALGVVDLARGRREEARGHLAAARGGLFHPAAFGEERILLHFLREGRFEEARAYAGHRLLIRQTPSAAYYLGVAEKGLRLFDDAERHLGMAAGHSSFSQRVATQRESITRMRRQAAGAYLFDARGEAVDPKTIEGFGLRLDPRDRLHQVRLSLDMEIQRAAQAALGAQRGSLVVLDMATGGLLAAASYPPPGRGGANGQHPALWRLFEPGSIIKMLTLSAALRQGIDPEKLFPLDCAGRVVIDGREFQDWIRHGRVGSLAEAVAVSCNIAFGRLGELAGKEALDAELRRYGFDSPPQEEIDFPFTVGTISPEDLSAPAFSLSRRAIGLDTLAITPVGSALIAAGLGRGGPPPAPHLIEEKRNVLEEAYYSRAGRHLSSSSSDPLIAERAGTIVSTMKAAVTAPNGTARRAAVKGLTSAMKTGTSGENPPGHDAVVIGFAPAEKPAIAWALLAERAGKAELRAARITGDFLKRIRHRLP